MVFLDCEFTSLEDPKLLSIALVAEEGRELYVELSGDSHLKRASTFVIETVAPQFGLVPHAETSRIDIGKRVGAWLLEFSVPSIDVLYDFHADMELLESSLREAAMWTRIKSVLVPTHIGYLIGETVVTTAMETSWSASFAADGIERHHAFADARALRAGYFAMHGGGPSVRVHKTSPMKLKPRPALWRSRTTGLPSLRVTLKQPKLVTQAAKSSQT